MKKIVLIYYLLFCFASFSEEAKHLYGNTQAAEQSMPDRQYSLEKEGKQIAVFDSRGWLSIAGRNENILQLPAEYYVQGIWYQLIRKQLLIAAEITDGLDGETAIIMTDVETEESRVIFYSGSFVKLMYSEGEGEIIVFGYEVISFSEKTGDIISRVGFAQNGMTDVLDVRQSKGYLEICLLEFGKGTSIARFAIENGKIVPIEY